ncbi:MAG TPA: sodium:solute symporter [bacterium]|nr:sodium/solute symporter [Myxococcales bacterium]OQA61961.1 MAG: Sodium/glucose cotransporter [bacterium ADurb.Bin270]HPW44897.1 sodium:solute symporter [bacterium]HQH80259.1 sodium:solute symporter [bacterium]
MLSMIDVLILAAYFVVVMGVGFYFTKRESTSTDYFLASRHIGWIAIGASLFATNISSEHFIGLAGTGAASGLAVGHFEWLACIIVLILGWIFVPFYLKSGVFTMPEFLEKRFNKTARRYLTIISIVGYVLTKISVTLYAGSLLLKHVLGVEPMTGAIIMVVATGAYTIAGGLKAVIYTELFQTFVLIGGALVLTIIGLNQVGGFEGLYAKLPPDYFHMFKPWDHPDFPWTGIIFGAPILGIWYWCTDQYIVQRVLSAKGLDDARSGTIFAGFLKILPVFILVLPGLIAAALWPEIRGDMAYPNLVTGLLPVGMKGLVIAGLLAALMSSLAACFNSTSTLFTMDLYKPFRKYASERELVLVGRIATALLVVIGLLWIPFIKYLSSQIYIYLQSVQAYISPPIAVCFLLGLFWKRANGKGAIAALFVGFILGAVRFGSELAFKAGRIDGGLLSYYASANFLHIAVFIFVVCSAIFVFVSLMTDPPAREKIAGLTWSLSGEAVSGVDVMALPVLAERPWWRKINILMSVVLVLILLMLWWKFF